MLFLAPILSSNAINMYVTHVFDYLTQVTS